MMEEGESRAGSPKAQTRNGDMPSGHVPIPFVLSCVPPQPFLRIGKGFRRHPRLRRGGERECSFPLSPAGRSRLPPQVIPAILRRSFPPSPAGRSRLPPQVIPAFSRRSFRPSSAGRSRLPPQVIPAFPCRLFPCLPLQVIPRREPGHPACRQWGAASCFGMCGQNGLSPPR